MSWELERCSCTFTAIRANIHNRRGSDSCPVHRWLCRCKHGAEWVSFPHKLGTAMPAGIKSWCRALCSCASWRQKRSEKGRSSQETNRKKKERLSQTGFMSSNEYLPLTNGIPLVRKSTCGFFKFKKMLYIINWVFFGKICNVPLPLARRDSGEWKVHQNCCSQTIYTVGGGRQQCINTIDLKKWKMSQEKYHRKWDSD